MPLPRLVLVLSCLVPLFAPMQSNAQAVSVPREYRVLMVGNSLTYANNLPALLRAVGIAQGTPITTETYVAPGGTLAQRWRDGHAADALGQHVFDVVVLQEIGGQAACLASVFQQRSTSCSASLRAHQDFARRVAVNGAKLLLFTTWSLDADNQHHINDGMQFLAKQTKATVFDAAGAIGALQKTQPDARPYPDGVHPSLQASLMLALALYQDISGSTPIARDLRVTATLFPINTAISANSPLELQSGLTVDGKVTVIPTRLVEPLIKALPAPSSAEMAPSHRGR